MEDIKRRVPQREVAVRLLQGEDPATDHAADARRWIAIYGELLAFNREILARLHGIENGAAKPGLDVDGLRAERELDRLHERLAFWQARHRDLAGVDFDEERGVLLGPCGPVALTARESQLLCFLLTWPNRHFLPSALAAQARHDSRLAPEQVRSYVVRLRRRIEEAGVGCRIDSRRGHG